MSDMSDFEQLKPCPFCGSHPNEGSVGSSVPGMEDCGYLYIECRQCNGTSGKPFIGVHGDDKEVLRGIWNTRAAKQSMQGEAVEWQYFADGKWSFFIDDRHKQNTIEAGYEVRPLFTHAPDSAARIAELEAENEALRKELEEAKKAVEWQPIETAPKDKLIDILIDGNRRWADCYFDDVCQEWRKVTETGDQISISCKFVTNWFSGPDVIDRISAFTGPAIRNSSTDASLNIKGGGE